MLTRPRSGTAPWSAALGNAARICSSTSIGMSCCHGVEENKPGFDEIVLMFACLVTAQNGR